MSRWQPWAAALARAWRGPLGRLARAAILVACIVVLVTRVDVAHTAALMARANAGLLVAATITLVAVQGLAAMTWWGVSNAIGSRIGRRDALVSFSASQAVGLVTPGSVGGDAYRIVDRQAEGDPWQGATVAVLHTRAGSLASLALIAGVAAASQPSTSGIAVPLIGWCLALALALAVPSTWVAIRRLPNCGWRHATRAAGIAYAGATAFHVIAITAAYALVIAVDPRVGGPAVLAALVIARLAIAVPLTPSGIGIGEGIAASLFVALGLPPEVAVAASLLGRVSLLATAGLGAVLLLVGGRRMTLSMDEPLSPATRRVP